MKNSPYLDQPFVPLAVALRSMLAETEAKIPTAAPAEKSRLQQRSEVLREWITPKSITRSQPKGQPRLELEDAGRADGIEVWHGPAMQR
jgi:hypothetical protein